MNVALTRIVAAGAAVLAGVAVKRELDKPAEEREWNGDVGGVPYDFRAPTPDKVVRSVWDPDNPKIVGKPLFGVGWSINFARLAAIAQAANQPTAPARPPTATPPAPTQPPTAATPEPGPDSQG